MGGRGSEHGAAPLRLVIAGGGTGGHVQPAVATLQELRRRVPLQPLWLGSAAGLERSVAADEGIPFRAIAVGKLRRYFSLQTPLDALRIPLGVAQSLRHLRAARPDLVFSTGGFVSVPTVVAARLLGIPSLTHEQTAVIGLATRINARFVDVIALSYERSRALLGAHRGRVIVTGNPIRASLYDGDPAGAFRAFGLDPNLPLVYVTGGALGAQAINSAVREALPRLLARVQVIHQCGRTAGEEERLHAAREALPPELQPRYAIRPFIGPELADIYAAAVLVVGRAGAGTVAELSALGKPSLLIPLPGSAGGEQQTNARMLEESGASVVLPQEQLSPERLAAEIEQLIAGKRLSAMAVAARTRGTPDAAARLADALLALAARPASSTSPTPR